MNEKPSREIFSERLVSCRKERGLTQADVAAALGISDKTYSKWETGETDPGISSVFSLASFYGVSPAYFFERVACGDTERSIDRMFHDLSPEETMQKAFEIQFYAIRGLLKCASEDHAHYEKSPRLEPPPNRVDPKGKHNAFTKYSNTGVYAMMHNGTDANLTLSMLPNKDNFRWLMTERDELAEYLTFLGSAEFMKCVPFMIAEDFPLDYTAGYLAKCAHLPEDVVENFLLRCVKMGICSMYEVNLEDEVKNIFYTQVGQNLVGILTLVHLTLPTYDEYGYISWNAPARQVVETGETGGEKG